MMLYNGKKWTSYFRREGTVLFKAFPYAFVVSLVAGVLKYMDKQGIIALSEMDIIKNSAAYGGFTFVLSFLLVFRSSQCYNRFWTVAASCCTMRAQFGEAASSLLTFAIMTTKTPNEVHEFAHKVVRLTSLLHALCLQHAADMSDNSFPIIDAHGLGKGRMQLVAKLDAKARVDLVYQWLAGLIMHNAKSGLISAPPPILSRVFQELEKAMIEYNQVLQVMSIPFPYPYAQVTVMLLFLNMICTPVVMCYYVGHPLVAAMLSFIVVLCFVSIELISSELENPLGDDDNDLPCHAWQKELNETLLCKLNPNANENIELEKCAILDESIFLKESFQPLDAILIAGEETPPDYKGVGECDFAKVYVPTFPVQPSAVVLSQSDAAKAPATRGTELTPAPATLHIERLQPSSAISSTTDAPATLGTEVAQAAAPLQIEQASATLHSVAVVKHHEYHENRIEETLRRTEEHMRSCSPHQSSGGIAKDKSDATLADGQPVSITMPQDANQDSTAQECLLCPPAPTRHDSLRERDKK